MLAGMISSPSAYSPRNFPENALERRNQVLQNMVDQGYITQEEYNRTASRSRDPDGREIQPPAENSAGPVLHLMAAPAARRPLRRRRGLRRRPADQVDARPRAPAPGRGRRQLDAQRRRAHRLARRPRQQDGRRPGDGRRPELPGQPVQPGHRTATASPGRRSSRSRLITALEQGHSPDEVYNSEPQQIPFRAKVKKRNGKGSKIVPELFKVTTTTTPTSAPPRSRRRPRTPTTPSTPSSAPRWARRTSPRPRRRWGSTPTSPPRLGTRSPTGRSSPTTRR